MADPNYRVLVMEKVEGITAKKWITAYDGYHEAATVAEALEISRNQQEESL